MTPLQRPERCQILRRTEFDNEQLYQLGRSVMYVNRGIGVAGPAVRFNCRREMAMVELT